MCLRSLAASFPFLVGSLRRQRVEVTIYSNHPFAVESDIDARRPGDGIVVVPRRDREPTKVLLRCGDLRRIARHAG
jgi:hypothetical protein